MHIDSIEALKYIRSHYDSSQRIAFVSGNFNIVHPGHLRLLKHASDVGQLLVVGVNKDGTPGAAIPEELRLEGVQAIGLVDYAFILRDPAADVIAEFKPALVVKGKEHESEFNAEREIVEGYGGHLVFSSGEVAFSSLDLIRHEFAWHEQSTIIKPCEYPQRHGFAFGDLKKFMSRFSDLHVLVIGDLIVDEYIQCDPLGMSAEDPTIVVTPVLSERFLGGAGIVASHTHRLGAKVNYISIAGKDEPASFARDKLCAYGVDATIFSDDSRPTTLKQRYRVAHKSLLRVSHLKHHDIDRDLQKQVLQVANDKIAQINLVILSDFNYGTLPQPLVEAIIDLCRGKKIPIVADSQSSSQIGDVSRFHNMLLLKPTEREARLALRDFSSGLVTLAEALRQKTNSENVILTLGSEGLLINSKSSPSLQTDRLPAFNLSPKDVTGAGDSFLSAASLMLISGANIWQSAYVGSLAAACQVARVGNLPLNIAEVLAEIDR